MSSSEKTQKGTKDNLARIRDNQRRSRARRKEYLQDLERKYRACEQAGIEASAEIQAAARKVLEENKRLRLFLREKGFSEQDIGLFFSKDVDDEQHHPPAAPALESMLNIRKPCPGSTNCFPPSGSKSAQKTTLPAPPPLPSQHLVVQSTPSWQVSDSPVSDSFASTDSSMGPATATSTPMTPNYPEEARQDDYMTYRPQPMLSHPVTTVDTSWHLPVPEHGLYQQQADFISTTSCVYAANIIRSMRGDVGVELETDLGCHQFSPDCNVDNSRVFEVMDKYSWAYSASHP